MFDWQKPGHAFEGCSWALAPAFSFEHVHHMMKKLHQILLHVDILPKNKEPSNHGLEPMNPQKKIFNALCMADGHRRERYTSHIILPPGELSV